MRFWTFAGGWIFGPRGEKGVTIARVVDISAGPLIVTAVNACVAVNPDNPIAVAEGMLSLVTTTKKMVELLRVTGPRIVAISLEAALAKVEGKGK